MSLAPLIIVADRNTLKAFVVEQTPARGPIPRLVETFQIGDFDESPPAGSHQEAWEHGPDPGISRQLANQIRSVLRQHHPAHWAFAAPAEINGVILETLTPELRDRLDANVQKDLTKTAPTELPQLFEQPRE